MNRTRFLFALTGLAAASMFAAGPASSDDLHLRLVSSAPEADSTVAPPSEIRLTFSQVPQEGSTSVRLLDHAESLIETGKITHSGDGEIFHAPVGTTLADGSYTVAWRTMADDGHVIRGEIPFVVKSGTIQP